MNLPKFSANRCNDHQRLPVHFTAKVITFFHLKFTVLELNLSLVLNLILGLSI